MMLWRRLTSKEAFLAYTLTCILAVIGGVSFSFWCAKHVKHTTTDLTYDEVHAIPKNNVGLVLGTSRNATFGVNLFFKYRMEAAAELYKAGKVNHLLVSGDNHKKGYDEATDMRDYLIKLGVPKTAITLDYAGFRTYDSVIRCREVFGQNKITIISQRFHNERALYLAKHLGLDAVAYNAQDLNGREFPRREYLARMKAWLDIHVLPTAPRFLGDPVKINS